MTRKHYEKIASMLALQENLARTNLDAKSLQLVETIAHNLAFILKEENPRFDRDKFLTACNVR